MEKELISVVVITYNASKSIIETLDSINKQSYSPLELIISDDCSKDNTVELCDLWVLQNGSRFSNVKIIENKENHGVSANANIGVKVANGTWIKTIGDDILLPNAIEETYNFAKKHNADLVTAKVICFDDATKKELEYAPAKKFVFPQSPQKLLIAQLKNHVRPQAPTWLYKKQIFDEIGGFDERFPLLEDYPFFLRLLQNKYSVAFYPKATVRYRITNNSLSKSKNKSGHLKEPYVQCGYSFFTKCTAPALLEHKLYIHFCLQKAIWKCYLAKVSSKDKSIFRYLAGGTMQILYKISEMLP